MYISFYISHAVNRGRMEKDCFCFEGRYEFCNCLEDLDKHFLYKNRYIQGAL